MTNEVIETEEYELMTPQQKRVKEAWATLVSASKEQGIEMMSGTPSFVIGVTHDGALIQQGKTYPDGSQRYGCPPFPMESPLEQQRREEIERLETARREQEYRHLRQLAYMKQQAIEAKENRRLERARMRMQQKESDKELERWFLTELPRLIYVGE